MTVPLYTIFEVAEGLLILHVLLHSHHLQCSAVNAAPTNGNFHRPFDFTFQPALMCGLGARSEDLALD